MLILAQSCNSGPPPDVWAVEIDPLTEDQTDNQKDEKTQQLTEPSPHLSNTQVTNANLEQ